MQEMASEETGDRRTLGSALLIFRALTIIVPCVAVFMAVEFTGKQNADDIKEIKATLATLVSAPLSVQQNTKDIEELKASRTAMYSKMSDTFSTLDHKISEVDLKLNAISVNQAQIGQSVQDIKDGLREDRTRHNR